MKSAATAPVPATTRPPDRRSRSKSTTWSSAAASRGAVRVSRTVTGSGRRRGPPAHGGGRGAGAGRDRGPPAGAGAGPAPGLGRVAGGRRPRLGGPQSLVEEEDAAGSGRQVELGAPAGQFVVLERRPLRER